MPPFDTERQLNCFKSGDLAMMSREVILKRTRLSLGKGILEQANAN